jgi:hypothetical protein
VSEEEGMETLIESNTRDLNLKMTQCMNQRSVFTFCRLVGKDIVGVLAPLLATITASIFSDYFISSEVENSANQGNSYKEMMVFAHLNNVLSETIRSIIKNARDCKISEIDALQRVHVAIKKQFKNEEEALPEVFIPSFNNVSL